MPVSENVSSRSSGKRSPIGSAGSSASRKSGISLWLPARASAFAALCAFGMQPIVAEAQATLPMTPDRSGSNHPVVGVSASGVPLVNIVAPNQSGVSLNNFTHYNVGTKGAVIVNTPRSVQTQIAGWVQGNPLMGNSHARLIINQVTSGNPTRLLGMTEIAGNRANLVIANPAGITCAGCGFINVPRVSLATARPAFNADGSLAGFDVTRGHLGVAGAGLDARGSAIDLIARAMSINAQVWAESIHATAGANQVGYATGTATSQLGEGEKPGIAIDVHALGGMYANSVRLVGTEAGVGVRNSGGVSSLTGNIELSANGDITIEPAGRIQSAGELSVGAPNLTNKGAIVGSRAVHLEAEAMLQNDGVIGALSNADLTSRDLINRGDVIAGVSAIGAPAGPGSVTLTGINVSSSGMLAAGDNVNVTGMTVSLDRGALYAASALNVKGDRSLTTREATAVASNTTLRSNGTFINDRGSFDTFSDTKIDARSVSNRGGGLSSHALTMTANGVDNTGGTLIARGRAQILATSLTNEGGGIGADDHLSIELSRDVSNRQGLIAAGNRLALSAGSLTSNTSGRIGSFAGDASLNFQQDAHTEGGLVIAAGNLDL
ncbi:MAG: filamentous hemagglutinin N-terminal domain-containing protein, partial [Trinickia sp.]